eukprot:TRINITY_DN75971_c0_g1_i1.p1 TRINITY_DN75971_c0_g1~~TRINITY_DN75971_c0_g1_i1.p1  ORF type:complete len:137 (-),score=6.00 TRINITY_DN75971_c0_g1_i1:183-593(-)
MDPAANIWNSSIWSSPTAHARNLKLRSMSATGVAGVTTCPKRPMPGTQSFERTGDLTPSYAVAHRTSSVPSMPTMGGSCLGPPVATRPQATLGYLQPMPKDRAARRGTSVPGQGHGSLNGTQGFSQFYNATGNKWL